MLYTISPILFQRYTMRLVFGRRHRLTLMLHADCVYPFYLLRSFSRNNRHAALGAVTPGKLASNPEVRYRLRLPRFAIRDT